jgi:uncharacterized RDD family membrane protein YckC
MENEILDKDLLIENAADKREYAGFWIRVGASLIDLVVYLPVLGVNMYNLYFLKSLPLQLITTFVLLVYKPFMEYRYGATLGKMAVKIKVMDSDSGSITIPQAVIRNLPSLLSQLLSVITAVLLFLEPDFQEASSMMEVAALQKEVMSPIPNYVVSLFYMVSCITVAFSATKQGLHDMMAGTFCVKQVQ